MARRSKKNKPEELRKKLLELLIGFEKKLLDSTLREQIQELIPANHLLRDLGSSLIDDDSHSAKGRILAYLKKYPKVIIAGDELMVVAGISEYARRIRELRKEQGWMILSGTMLQEMAEQNEISLIGPTSDTKHTFRPDDYILLNTIQDRDAAHRWHTANSIRKEALSMKDKIIKFMRLNIGKAVTGEEIRYLAKDSSEWARRIRELRTEEGWLSTLL